MKPLLRSFGIFMYQITRDNMLWAVCIAPLLVAVFFRWGIPHLETLLCVHFQQQTVLSEYYLLFDLFLSLITPYLFCFAAAMVMLTEYDENITSYMAITPIGKKGYVLSRLLLPAVISFFASMLLMHFFTLTVWPLWVVTITCLLTSLLSVVIALLIFTFSHNRVEGMAVAKLSGLVMLGLPVPFFLSSGLQYLFSPLPSFWIAKFSVERDILLLLPAILFSLLWVRLLYRKFEQKLVQ